MNQESALWRAYRSKGDLRTSSVMMNGDCHLSGGFRLVTHEDMELAEREMADEAIRKSALESQLMHLQETISRVEAYRLRMKECSCIACRVHFPKLTKYMYEQQ